MFELMPHEAEHVTAAEGLFLFVTHSSLPSGFLFLPQLEDFKSELAGLRVEQVTGGSASKVASMYVCSAAEALCGCG